MKKKPANKFIEENVTGILGDVWEEDENEESSRKLPRVGKHSIAGKKLPKDIPLAPLDTVSFHAEENVVKWKYEFYMRIVPEMELSEEAQKINDVVQFLGDAYLVKTVVGIGPYYPRIVKEFIANLPS